ncbi:Hypothetical_protein [Hexamita inflata]|uniref:Hypothetical_protein n=1 Tax=Hexamita inflata TaxID=28002 RepID=A0AA86QD57_9EUKA|nr:Hypothetical protein HINF_LOCUS40313 [Hexamita inflata]
MSNVKICTNIQYSINNGVISQVNLTTQPTYACDEICGQYIPVYGLCQIDLNNGYLNIINDTKYCVKPFIFNDYECICAPGYLLNGTVCINILQSLTNLDQFIFDNFSTLDNQLKSNISNISNQLVIISDQLRVDLLSVNSTLNSQIQSVITNMSNIYNSLQSQINSNLASISSLNTQFTSFKSEAIIINNQQNTQIQNIIAIENSQKLVTDSLRIDLTSSTNSLQTQINSLNSNLQGTNNQVSTTQNNINSLQTQINNINSVNSIQNSDISSLKTQIAGSGGSGALMCSLTYDIYYESSLFRRYGYCLNIKRCCYLDGLYYLCIYNNAFFADRASNVIEYNAYTIAQCGTFIQI